MTARLHWTGVRMRTLRVTTDPDDSATRSVTLPAAWEDDAAQALTQITQSGGPLRLSTEAARWVDMIDACPPLPGTPANTPSPGRSLSCLLLMRQLAPNIALWERHTDEMPGFIVRLSGFVQDDGFAPEHFVACLKLACDSLRRLHAATRIERTGELPLFDLPVNPSEESAGLLLLTDLDACLASMGLDYDSEDGRNAAKAIAALATSIARAGTDLPLPSIPECKALPDLRGLAAQACATQEGRHLSPIETGFSAPGAVDALLGVEACGLAPVFSPLRDDGHLRASTLARLAHRGLTPESALALALAGETPLPPTRPEAHAAMHRFLEKSVDFLPELPEPELANLRAKLERGVRRPLPMRQTGFTQRTAVGGHNLFMRTSEFEDGTLGEISIIPTRESPMARGLMDCLGQAVSIGLQFGAPLEAFVERFAYTRFGPAGTVEGDPGAAYASSMLDYAFRTLSEAYLGQHMPDAPQIEPSSEDPSPMLPFDHSSGDSPRGRRLRLVS
ncbi:TSCPD domain-containing protein [Gluconobacter japonicus]|uniref:TSCPD domain-containing protein n=1 Tax=Gluconobacter japonicus TaxID=376620 RepID=UPI000783A00E|nr:vitamin B12-dependent ribonucleotide reductase [Gluconobacter japonicus]KXV27167.1 vitamin B12-dependent ribonucleotide reductase [Gluconobacter japonicus]MBS1051795.1 vitamin B12-dependent ribonucleotide reductase [Gluconobacter japonicus]